MLKFQHKRLNAGDGQQIKPIIHLILVYTAIFLTHQVERKFVLSILYHFINTGLKMS